MEVIVIKAPPKIISHFLPISIPKTSYMTLYKLDPNRSSCTPNQPNSDIAITIETINEPYLPRANVDIIAVDRPVLLPTIPQKALKTANKKQPIPAVNIA